MNYKRRISTSISVLALFLSLVIPISNQAFVESSSPRQKVSHVSDARMNRSNLVDRSSIVKAVDKNETVSNKRNTVVTWRGGQSDHRWSNPANWVGGHVPGAFDVARFSAHSKSDVEVDSIGMIAGLELEPGYSGTVTLKHDLLVAGEVVIASGSFEQGSYSLSARQYSQNGGVFNGGSTKVTISGEATVSGGTLTTPRLMSAESLLINSPGVVRMSANGKLELSGNGEPLKGSGLLDVTTDKPNSVEYTGQANVDLTAARPAMQLHSTRHIARDDMPSEPESSQGQDAKTPETPESFGKLGSLTLNRGDSYLEAAAIDTAASAKPPPDEARDQRQAEKPALMMIDLTERQRLIISHMSVDPVHVDALIDQTALSAQDVLQDLTLLSLKGVVRRVDGQSYVRAKAAT